MAARDTRMLVLGAVAIFEPVNGYQIRRELTSWRIDEWANVNPGSVYSALTRLERDGLVVRHDLVDVTREVAVYEVTDAGHRTLRAMMVAALETADPHSRVAFHVAFGMLALLEREQVVDSLRVRLRNVEAQVAELDRTEAQSLGAPPHARRGLVLWSDLERAELGWLRETLERIESGRLLLQSEESGWVPPDDDPGWQMQADRARYLALLGRADPR